MVDGETQVTLTENELLMLVLAINTSKDYLQGQKGSIVGAMMGFTKIDTLCTKLDKLKAKLTGE